MTPSQSLDVCFCDGFRNVAVSVADEVDVRRGLLDDLMRACVSTKPKVQGKMVKHACLRAIASIPMSFSSAPNLRRIVSIITALTLERPMIMPICTVRNTPDVIAALYLGLTPACALTNPAVCTRPTPKPPGRM